MENAPKLTIPQRLTIEKQLLREEKYIVHALKTVKEERYALQREGADLLCLLKEVLSQGQPRIIQSQVPESAHTVPEPAMDQVPSITEDLACLDDIVNNEVELNLTVPSHSFYDQMPEEEYEEAETEDDYEIEMSMLMNGDKAAE